MATFKHLEGGFRAMEGVLGIHHNISGPRPAPALLGVLLASFATLLSYGLLAFSHTPALRGFGLTLGAGVLAATLLAPLALAPGGRPPAD